MGSGHQTVCVCGDAVAAFVSPLIFGAMADRQASPVKVLRGWGWRRREHGAGEHGHRAGWGPGVVLALIQLHALCSAPTFSISSAIIFARLADARMEFGRSAHGTLG